MVKCLGAVQVGLGCRHTKVLQVLIVNVYKMETKALDGRTHYLIMLRLTAISALVASAAAYAPTNLMVRICQIARSDF
jgi:hypothetical protein